MKRGLIYSSLFAIAFSSIVGCGLFGRKSAGQKSEQEMMQEQKDLKRKVDKAGGISKSS